MRHTDLFIWTFTPHRKGVKKKIQQKNVWQKEQQMTWEILLCNESVLSFFYPFLFAKYMSLSHNLKIYSFVPSRIYMRNESCNDHEFFRKCFLTTLFVCVFSLYSFIPSIFRKKFVWTLFPLPLLFLPLLLLAFPSSC